MIQQFLLVSKQASRKWTRCSGDVYFGRLLSQVSDKCGVTRGSRGRVFDSEMHLPEQNRTAQYHGPQIMPTGFKVRRGFILKTQKPPATARASCYLLNYHSGNGWSISGATKRMVAVDRGEISFISTVNKTCLSLIIRAMFPSHTGFPRWERSCRSSRSHRLEW